MDFYHQIGDTVIRLRSINYPEVRYLSKDYVHIFLWGDDKEKNDRILDLETPSYFQLFIETVQEYNRIFASKVKLTNLKEMFSHAYVRD